ncbi:acyltransferase family protein, partial [Escherichia coli]|uniref:acyltransferase family protein n=1 Tax=Escherichia coli TaxID=562 RepID=UPI001BFCDC9A
IGPDPRNFNQRVSLGRNDLLIRTFLRFFAAAMIVLGHGHGLFGSLGIATTISLAQGVSFFFVLSGFILTYNYPKLKTFAEVKGFYVARFARILPSHLFAMLLLVIFTGGINQGGLQGAAIAFTAFLGDAANLLI